ncbi:MAG: ATP-dependent DNA helicase RecG [Bacteroidales bacterium]|nr:ATP-dependent DNA helicase RecG [Bacteroidales bacterium]
MSEFSKIDIKFLAGVGPKRAEILKKEIGVATYEDLLYYFPYKYIDRSKIFKINEIDGNFPYIQIEGEIISYEEVGTGRAKRLSATFSDGTGTIELVWFKGAKYIKDSYRLGTKYTVFGKPTQYGSKISIAHPEIDKVEPITERKHTLQGYYSTTEEMKKKFINSKVISKLVESIFRSLKVPIFETISVDVAKECNLVNINDALRNIHFPKSNDDLQRASFRLKFEELFYIQLNILRYMKLRERSLNGFKFKRIGDNVNDFYKYSLPFELTNAQKRVIKEIRYDMGSGKQMNRLLQGDVGSGKTLVAIMSMLIAADNDFQACIMAPTEILATQHYENIKRLLSKLNINIALLTGSTKKSERDTIDKGLKDGSINFIVGTHALIEDNVVFKNLGLVIIDEQHRFGVVQRSKLWKKNNQPPHILVMTATPIPRTLAMTLYGDLDVSIIDELPPGRKPISTILRFDSGADKMYSGIRKQIEAGRQVYIVYPLIKESEKSDLKNLEEGYNYVKNLFKEYEVCMVHGKMKSSEKEEEMQKFASGKAKIMVATTVIEVGVDVPNASVMVIENAERFGLAQLHQLRGRVGRGAEQSYCILKTSHKLSENSRKRLDIMCKTNDGFEIAEADLKLRGPGDMEGTQQSGMAFNLKIANITRDAQILQLARDCASRVLERDPDLSQPEHLILKLRLDKLFKRIVNFGLVG